MPVQAKKSAFGVDFRALMDKHKDDPIRTGFQSLPPGLDGVATLTVCEIRTGENGNPYWYAEATIETPEYKTLDDGSRLKVRGRQTRQFVWPGESAEEKEAAATKVQEEMRKLGGPTFLDDNQGATIEELSALLMECKPPIRFNYRTSLGKPSDRINPKTGKPYEPRVWENWNGTDNVPEPGADDISKGHFLDNTGSPKPSANGTHSPQEGGYEEADVDALIARGQAGEDGILERVTEMCLANGWDKETVDNTDWPDIRPLMVTKKEAEVPKTATKAAAPAAVTPPKDFVPTVGDFVEYATNPKGGRKTRCEVKTVNKSKKTVTLLSQVDRKTEYKDVPWDKLVYTT